MTGSRIGRQPSTSHSELSHLALQLFIERGFENTTVDQVAAAAGIGRRTLFRYFPSKNDLPWGDFDGGLEHMRTFLRELPVDLPMIEALSLAVIDFNKVPASEIAIHRERMQLLLNVPALAAHATLRYVAWRGVVAEFAGVRLGLPATSASPQVVGWTFLAVSLAAYEEWLRREDADLEALLRSALETVREVFGVLTG